MKKIVIANWKGGMVDVDGIDQIEYTYTKEKRNALIDACMESGQNVMLLQMPENLVIFIDKDRFRQS